MRALRKPKVPPRISFATEEEFPHGFSVRMPLGPVPMGRRTADGKTQHSLITQTFAGKPMVLAAAAVLWPATASAMHISEGILPAPWAALWFLASLPFLALGMWRLRERSRPDPHFKALVGLVGSAVFIISCMPVPVPTAGTCSHPCGTGLAAILIGPALTVVVTSVALTLQALFLAHGGLTTLGADIVSMGVAGAFVGYGVFRLLLRLRAPLAVAAFAAGLLSDWATYAVTSFELASALHGDGSLSQMFVAILVAFVPTQLPLGILEGFLCAGAFRFVRSRRPELLLSLLGLDARRASALPASNRSAGFLPRPNGEEILRTRFSVRRIFDSATALLQRRARLRHGRDRRGRVKHPLFPFVAGAVLLAALAAGPARHAAGADWSGVDETVVEKFAREANRPARKPFINTDQGDLLLFVFLVAGTAGGFLGGYYFRELFPPRGKNPEKPADV